MYVDLNMSNFNRAEILLLVFRRLFAAGLSSFSDGALFSNPAKYEIVAVLELLLHERNSS